MEYLYLCYWKADRFWLGRLLEHPEIMTQGESLEELQENIYDIMGKTIDINPVLINANIKEARGFLKYINTDIEREPDRM